MPVDSARSAFVTGGSGFLGRALIATLCDRGYEVRALARSERAVKAVRSAGAQPVPGDLESTEALEKGMQGTSVVFHAAAQVALWGKREDFWRATVKGTQNVLEAARAAKVPRLVHVSTEAVLAGGRPLIDADETWPLPTKPLGLYPWSKGLAERSVLEANRDGLEAVIVRPRFIWGSGDTTLLPELAKAMTDGRWRWFGGGHHRMSTCHVKNVCEGTVLAAERGRAGEVYFLTDGDPVEHRWFVSELVKTQGVAPTTREAPMWLAEPFAWLAEGLWRILGKSSEPPLTRTAVTLFFREVTVSDAKARRELGYQPVISVAGGLDELRTARG